jgi:hypothetical protein
MDQAMNRLCADREDHRAFQFALRRCIHDLRRSQYVRDVEVTTNPYSLFLDVTFTDTRAHHYEFRWDELHMEGLPAFEQFLDEVRRGVSAYLRRFEAQDRVTSELHRRMIDAMMLRADPLFIGPPPVGAPETTLTLDSIRRAVDQLAGIPFGLWGEESALAEKKSRELFRKTAGDDAYALLDAGKPLPITGSQGTQYLLHKKASFCIERVSDRARLCAVVPGVPLWDHLLGIKLMVENDEPAFLKTANVSGGGSGSSRAWREMHPGYVDVDEAAIRDVNGRLQAYSVTWTES